MIKELKSNELEVVAGGPIWFGFLVVPAVKLSTAAKTAAVGLGGAAGVAGATTALNRD
ncbi:hypothetical protein HME9302_00104 [Alteripontixanthobacter maritimus]|uniref:Uncharacterized protein n=1 Tax=Alteripontixanthobacter maritimus TaxID=2161824 RepID=A0A369Q9G6_9SPHN|nr:hypothetical protein HME9302_00104 [Alteripontixanthobacter maritimus]